MLDPIRLYLDGWMSYDKETIPLNEEGITYIKGATGSGKSAILEAIIYLLYGQTLRKRGSVENLPNKVLKGGYETWLEFYVDGEWCKIKEIRGRDNAGLYFWVGSENTKGSKHEKDPRKTRKIIIKKLRMSVDEFKSRAFLGQRQSQQLVEGDPAERGKATVEIFGLERYDGFIKDCDKDLKECLNEKKALTSKLAEYKDDLERLSEDLKVERHAAVDGASIEVLVQNIAAVKNKIKKIRDKEADLRNTIGKYEGLKSQREKAKKLSKDINDLQDELDQLALPKKDLHEIDIVLRSSKEQRAILRKEIQEYEKELQELNKCKNVCPINEEDCPVDVPQKTNKQRTNKCITTIKAAEQELGECDSIVTTYEEAYEAATDRACVVTKIRTKQEALATCDIEDISDVDEEKQTLDKCLDGITRGSNKLETLQEDHRKLLTQQELREEQDKFLEGVKKTLEDKQTVIKTTEIALEELSVEAQYLAAALAVFKRTKMYKIDLVLDLLNKNLQERLDEISNGQYAAKFISQQMDSKGKKSLDRLDILVNDGKKELPIGMVSGGQLTQVGLSVLLGVWETANNLSNKRVSFLWLDEVFGPLDFAIIDCIVDTIVKLSKELGAKSVKIISHRDLNENITDHIWQTTLVDGITALEMS
jgi:DNA repair exonuclease SbcCD ATPase subunit